MLPKHCAHCRTLFAPESPGLKLVFCADCIVACEEAAVKIRRHLEAHPSTTAPKLTMVLGVPPIFVYHLFRLGRFVPDLAQKPQHEKTQASKNTFDRRPCSLCGRALKPEDAVYCRPCNTVFEKRMHTKYNHATPGIALPEQVRTTQNNRKKTGTIDKFFGLIRR